jgi:hypothetical protein
MGNLRMRVVIAGSRKIKDYDFVEFAIKKANIHISEVVSGGANGVDSLGEEWAQKHDVKIKKFPADWDTHGKSAGPIRNAEMADYCHAAIIVWDGTSQGTFNMIENMRRRKKPYYLLIARTFNWWKD